MIMRHKSYMQKGATACTKKLATSYESWPQSAIVIASRVLPASPHVFARQLARHAEGADENIIFECCLPEQEEEKGKQHAAPLWLP
jgi:hypothetical protein